MAGQVDRDKVVGLTDAPFHLAREHLLATRIAVQQDQWQTGSGAGVDGDIGTTRMDRLFGSHPDSHRPAPPARRPSRQS